MQALLGNPISRERPPYRTAMHRLARIVLPALAFALIFCAAVPAQQSKPSEYSVKAVYLFNFGKFVQWPAAPGSTVPGNTFSICVLGDDPFGDSLANVVKGENINGLPLSTAHIDRVDDAANCRILFISASEEGHVVRILDALQSRPLLTVSDMAGFCDRGGMIQFVINDEKVRFEVNVAAADKAKLALSSQLLKVAISVRGGH
jgi:YfiR/HmsC-like